MSSHGITRADLQLVHLPRRRRVNRLMEGLATLAAAITVTVSVDVDGFLLVTGARTVTARARAVVDLPSVSPSP